MPKAPQPRPAKDPLFLDPGDLRHQVQLAGNKASGQDAFGQLVNAWQVYRVTWAKIEQLSGQELFQGDEFTSASQIRITLRWNRSGEVNVGDRVLFESHVYLIQIVDNILMRNLILQLTCLEIDGSS